MCFKKLWFHINMWLCVHPLNNKELNSNTLSDISKSILFSAWDCVWFQALLKLCNHYSLVIFDETWTSSLFICADNSWLTIIRQISAVSVVNSLAFHPLCLTLQEPVQRSPYTRQSSLTVFAAIQFLLVWNSITGCWWQKMLLTGSLL